jgi:predicted kinase
MQKPKLYLFVGYPGAGKTTVAKVIHEATGAVHLWADRIRRERFEHPAYSHEENLELYNHLNELTGELLRSGNSVLFDTNFNFYKDREHLRHIANAHGAEVVLIWLTTPKDVARHRATEEHHQNHTRVLGTMPPEEFDRMARNLQEPSADEQAIAVDGTKLNEEELKQKLGL